jgi:hypothetical protein
VKKSKVSYPGVLGKPIPPNPLNTELALLGPATEEEIKAYWADLYTARLYFLLTHYHIPHADEDRWFRLACALAKDHVPGFSVAERGRGRPKRWTTLADFISKHLEPRRRGARRKHSDAYYKDLLDWVRLVAKEQDLSGRGTIKAALEILIEETVRDTPGKSLQKARAEELPKLQKLYSKAKKKFPKLAI